MTFPFKIDLNLKTREGKFFLFICFFWVQRAWQPYLHAIFKMLSNDSTADTFVLVFKTFLLLFAMPFIIKRIRSADVCFYIFMLCLYGLSLLTSDSYAGPYLINNFWLIMICTVPLYFGGAYFKVDKHLELLYFLSILVIAGEFLFTILFQMKMDENTGEQMSRAYGILPHALMAWYFMFRKFDLFRIVVAISSFVLLFTCGTRGPILGFFVFIILYIIQLLLTKRLKLSTQIVITTMMVIVIASMERIFNGLTLFAEIFNMSGRVLDFIEAGEVSESYGREQITNHLMSMVMENPLDFRGIAGDMINGLNYAHNILVEMLVSYGILFGSLFILLIGILIVRGYFNSKTFDEHSFIIIIIGAYLVQLFVSSTYRESTGFFFLLGYCVQMIRNRSVNKVIKTI